MPGPTFWHIQLHQGEPEGFEHIVKILKERGVIGLHFENGDPIYRDFKERMQIGDIVLVRDGSNPVALVEVTGSWENTRNTNPDLDWFPQRRKVKIIAINENPDLRFPKVMGTLQPLVNDTAVPPFSGQFPVRVMA